ncbi:hypothetical protein TN53_35975 [Streptomyces sp. WM6386]|nr:hypothetical protein TN53_35975 [Streptomyces sp. WM6386]
MPVYVCRVRSPDSMPSFVRDSADVVQVRAHLVVANERLHDDGRPVWLRHADHRGQDPTVAGGWKLEGPTPFTLARFE